MEAGSTLWTVFIGFNDVMNPLKLTYRFLSQGTVVGEF